MKKCISCFVIIALLVIGISGYGMAYSNSGEYMFTRTGNDPAGPGADFSALEYEIENWFLNEKNIVRDIDLEYYAKVEDGDAASPDNFFSVTYEDDLKSGTWTALSPIEFYSVKAGTEYALYWEEGGAASGTWSTEHLVNGGGNIPEVSHLTAYNDTSAPVPEPATMLLLATGLFGVAGFQRKAIKKKLL